MFTNNFNRVATGQVTIKEDQMAEQKRDLLLELVQKTSTDEIHHLIEWLFEDEEEEDNDKT